MGFRGVGLDSVTVFWGLLFPSLADSRLWGSRIRDLGFEFGDQGSGFRLRDLNFRVSSRGAGSDKALPT